MKIRSGISTPAWVVVGFLLVLGKVTESVHHWGWWFVLAGPLVGIVASVLTSTVQSGDDDP